jgi:hypothetical protein
MFKKELPCQALRAIARHEVPPCVRAGGDVSHLRCPASGKLGHELDEFTGRSYHFGYSFVAWLVLQEPWGPSCEMTCFQSKPDAEELRQRYGDKLIALVPV